MLIAIPVGPLGVSVTARNAEARDAPLSRVNRPTRRPRTVPSRPPPTSSMPLPHWSSRSRPRPRIALPGLATRCARRPVSPRQQRPPTPAWTGYLPRAQGARSSAATSPNGCAVIGAGLATTSNRPTRGSTAYGVLTRGPGRNGPTRPYAESTSYQFSLISNFLSVSANSASVMPDKRGRK